MEHINSYYYQNFSLGGEGSVESWKNSLTAWYEEVTTVKQILSDESLDNS